MTERFSRSAMLLGETSIEKLSKSHIIIFGAGGVGGYVFEALARSGVGKIDIVDSDVVNASNINRQIIAIESTLGIKKVEAAKKRALEINPDIKINAVDMFFMPDNAAEIDFSKYDYVIDAIDTVTGKIAIIEGAKTAEKPIISCMGAGNKLNPMGFKVADIAKTKICPLARAMRKLLKDRGIRNVKVVYSEEEAMKPKITENTGEKPVPGSVSFVPAAAGLLIASEVVKDLINS